MAKSSQLGLHVWLPMAMEGPTPVSALIHAATMVTAGVYLLIRSSPLIEYSVYVLLSCLWLGTITTIFSSLIGLFQQDVKKIIAYSTMSQLGMMVIAIGLSCYNVAIYHLINHAFYKALLFLGAGSIIHAVADNQDLRKYGGLIKFLPLTYTVILIASLSLVAFPFMTGFYSKDFILESVYSQYLFSSINAYFIAIIGAIFTILYSLKIIYLTFLVYPDGPVNFYKNAHEGDVFLNLPLVILAIFSIYFGYLTRDIFVGLGSEFFRDNSLFIHPMHEICIEVEFVIPLTLKILPLILIVVLCKFWNVYSSSSYSLILGFKLSNLGNYMFGFLNQRFMIEFFYNKYIVETVLRIGGQTIKILDKGSIEWVGPYGIGVILTIISKIIYNLSKGIVTDYALYILLGICFYLSVFTFVRIFLDLVNSIMVSYVIVLMDICNLFTIHQVEYVVINNKLEIKSELGILFSRQYKYSTNFTYKKYFNKRTFSTTAFYMSTPNGIRSSGVSNNANGSQNGNVNGLQNGNVQNGNVNGSQNGNVQNGNVNGSNVQNSNVNGSQNGNMNSNNLNQNNNPRDLSLEEELSLSSREVAAREYQNAFNIHVNPEDLVMDRYGYYVHPDDLTTSSSDNSDSGSNADNTENTGGAIANADNIGNTGGAIASAVQEENARESESSNNNPQRDPNESNNDGNRDSDNSNSNTNNPQINSNESDSGGNRLIRRREEDDSDYDGDRIIRRPRHTDGNSNTSVNNSNPNDSNSNRRSTIDDVESTTKDIDKNHMENMDGGSEFKYSDESGVLKFIIFIIEKIIEWLFS